MKILLTCRISLWMFLAVFALMMVRVKGINTVSQQLLQTCMYDDDKTATVVIQNLLKNKDIDINARDPASGQTPLMAAVLRGKPLTVELLLDAGADPSLPEKDGYTPTHGAAFQGRTDVMMVLHKHGLSKQEYHDDGYLPFHRACWGNTDRHSAFVALLLKVGIIEDPEVLSLSDGKSCRQMTHNPLTIEMLDQFSKPEPEL
jgi:hypothetical protein